MRHMPDHTRGQPMRRLSGILRATPLLAALLAAACGSPATPSGPPGTPPSTPAAGSPSAPATAMTIDELVAGAAGLDGQPVRVKGFILVTDAGASMCSLLLESYPPQCGGAIRITGEIPADVAAGLEKTSEPGLAQAMWGWVEVAGTFEASGGGGEVALSEIRLAVP
jgi:hypothetical protein